VVEIFDRLRDRPVKKSLAEIEDFVLVRSNRVPTYYLACAVDDDEMGVNLMLRANEGEGSALRLELVRKSLGFQPVQCGFLPIMKSDAAWGGPIPLLDALRSRGVDGKRLAVYLLSLGKPRTYESLEAAFEDWASDAPLKGSSGRIPAISMETVESFTTSAPSGSLPEEKVAALIAARDEARRRKLYDEADRIRSELEDAGISISDGPDGTLWERSIS
jgi:glutamyl/glutaminyl-tRNA synthetase